MKIDRLLSLIMILIKNEKMTATKLAETLEVTKRTIYRDLDVLNTAGVPIFSTPGINGGIGIIKNYKFDKNFFKPVELINLLYALHSVPTFSKEDVNNTINKIRGMIPENQISDFEKQLNALSVDYSSWPVGKDFSKIIDVIRESINNSIIITFKYFDQMNRKTIRKIEPYKLLSKSGNWYVHGFCLDKHAFRIFNISRIFSLEITENTFTTKEVDLSTLEFLYKTQNIVESVVLRVDESLYEFMVEFCGKENIEYWENDKFIVNFPFVDNEQWFGRLIQFEEKCEILNPESIRLKMIDKLESILSLYKKD